MSPKQPLRSTGRDEPEAERADGDRLSASYLQDVDLRPSSESEFKLARSPEQRIDWRLLKAAVDASNSLIVIADARQEDCPLVYVNEQFRRFTGYRADEIIGENCRFLQRRADGSMDRDQKDLARLREAIRKGEHARVTLRNYKKDGIFFWNELFISPVFDHEDQLAYFIGVQNDVTERVEAVRQLRESTKTLSSFFDTAPVLMGVVEQRTSEHNKNIYVHVRHNQAAATFFGTTPGTMRGKTDQELGLPAWCAEQWSAAYAQTEETGESVRFECAYAPDGAKGISSGAISGRSFNENGEKQSAGERMLTVTVNFIERTSEEGGALLLPRRGRHRAPAR